MIRRTAISVGVAIASLGGVGLAATPAAAHNGTCTGSRSIAAVGRTVTGRESIACSYQHRYWSICGYLYYRSAATGNNWVFAASRCDDIDSGSGSTKTSHTYTLSATCDPLAGPVQEWWFGTNWTVGEGLQPHSGGGEITTTVVCV